MMHEDLDTSFYQHNLLGGFNMEDGVIGHFGDTKIPPLFGLDDASSHNWCGPHL
jgi:hypothetical protein